MFTSLILGIILILFTFYLNSVINPPPIPNIECWNAEDSVYFVISNPSVEKATDYNILISERWGGQSGSSFPVSEYCTVGSYGVDDRLTLIHCDYIPPKSNSLVSVHFENISKIDFLYDVWGETVKNMEDQIIKCKD